MVEFYISWCPGISESSGALDYIKNSKIIDGVEGSYESPDFYTFEKLGLKYSYHNPTFKKFDNINEPNFITDFDKNKLLRDGLRISAPKVIGFHPPVLESEFSDFIKNIKFLQKKLIDKELLIEPRPIWFKSDFENKKGFENSSIKDYVLNNHTENISSIGFLKKIMDDNGFGMLLDIAHTRISVLSLIKGGVYKGSVDDFFIELVKSLGDKIKQIHINDSKFTDGIYLDSHSMLTPDCESLRILKLISSYLKNLEFITLEIYSGFEPLEHVKELEREISLVKAALN